MSKETELVPVGTPRGLQWLEPDDPAIPLYRRWEQGEIPTYVLEQELEQAVEVSPRETQIRISSRKHVPFKEVWETLRLQEHRLYRIRVKVSWDNPEHVSFLFTGYETGAYCTVYTNGYGSPVDLQDCTWVRVLADLGPVK